MQHAMHQSGKAKGHYGRLLIMIALSFVAMYVLMYAMVDSYGNVFSNINQFYMAGLMAAPMLLIELLLMASMYPNRKLNLALLGVGLGFMVLCWVGIRQQAAVSDQQFLRSMIPHHGAAILMCEQNKLRDSELIQLCEEIMTSQQREIDFMQAKLREQR